MKRVLFVIVAILLLFPTAHLMMQDTPAPRVEITGVNPSQLPTVVVTANVFDRVGQPVFGLTKDNFAITGELADKATIQSVENITDNNLTFSVVLAIDTSSSMAGEPIERAKEAAVSFINTIGVNNPAVAIVAFASTERLVQDYTSDKTVLIDAINNLFYGGKTALYDGGLLAVQTAARSPSPRRAVIILSDGAEFGGRSSALRGDALTAALKSGVPVYTIGLGYGVDRSFLQELSNGTNAKNYESPGPDQLQNIYQSLAATLQSQYAITLSVNVPADGTTYKLGVQASQPDGIASATADLRAPIPVPIVSLPNLPTEAISQPTEITADVKADDAIASAEFQLNGATVATFNGPPYALTIDPATLAPGDTTVTFNITDSTGDVGTATQNITIAALPSNVVVNGLPQGDIAEETSVSLDVTGQTPGVSATYSVDNGTETVVTTVNDAPYTFGINPYVFTPGPHSLSIDVLNQGGVTTHVDQALSIAGLPPVVTISGIEVGQEISDSATAQVDVTTSQSPIATMFIKAGDTTLTVSRGETSETATFHAANFQPGTLTISAIVTDQNNQSTTQTVDVVIAALPPVVTVGGLDVGETLDANRTIAVSADSQTDISGITYHMDGDAFAADAKYGDPVDLDVEALGAGSHILSVEVTNAGGKSASVDVAFSVVAKVDATATAIALPSDTPSPTDTPVPTSVSASVGATNTPEATSTPKPPPTVTPNQAATDQAAATQTADAAMVDMMTQQAVSAAAAQATVNAQSTSDAEGTASAAAAQPTEQPTEVSQASTATEVAPAADTPTGEATVTTNNATPEPTLTSIPLTAESQSAATNNNILPIAVICIVGLLILLVVFVFAGRRRRTENR